MTLEEAIKHAEEEAKEQDKLCKRYDDASGYTRSHIEEIRTSSAKQCEKCADEYRQLAKWLKELRDYRKRMPSYEAGYNDAKREIALSGEYERVYERGKQDAEQTRWILVSENLPKENESVIASTEYGVLPEARYTKEFGWEWAYEAGADYWQEIEGITAWMPLPQPYKAASEETDDYYKGAQEEY